MLGKPAKYRLCFNIPQNIVEYIDFNPCKNVIILPIFVVFLSFRETLMATDKERFAELLDMQDFQMITSFKQTYVC